MAVLTRERKTVEDYLRLPDDVRCELFQGEYFMSPSPGFKHQVAVVKLSALLLDHVESRKLGRVLCAPFDCILSDEDVVQPDVLFVATGSLSKIRDRLYGAPDLAIEIISSGNAERDRIVKRDLYAKHGVREYWIVDPEARTLEVMSPDKGGWRLHAIFGASDEVTSLLLPNFRAAVRDIFA